MNFILLPGNSKHNKEWINKVADEFSGSFESVKVHHYRHWESGEEYIDFDYELKKVSEEVENNRPYVIFAKSIGSVLAIKGIFEGLLHPEKCVFAGLPLKLIIDDNHPVSEWLSKITVPILIAQNEDDPFGSFGEVKEFIDKVNNPGIKVIKLVGDTHDYDDIQNIKQFVLNFIQEQQRP